MLFAEKLFSAVNKIPSEKKKKEFERRTRLLPGSFFFFFFNYNLHMYDELHVSDVLIVLLYM